MERIVNKILPPQNTNYPIETAHISSHEQYQARYNSSVSNPENFWAEVAERITWFKKWDHVRKYDFTQADIKWFEGAKLNACYNCLDRHVESGHGQETALIWEGNNPSEDKTFTFNELLQEVKFFSNVLKSQGVEKGDRVCILSLIHISEPTRPY